MTELEQMFGRWYKARVEKASLARQTYKTTPTPEAKKASIATFLRCLVDEDHIASHLTSPKKHD